MGLAVQTPWAFHAGLGLSLTAELDAAALAAAAGGFLEATVPTIVADNFVDPFLLNGPSAVSEAFAFLTAGGAGSARRKKRIKVAAASSNLVEKLQKREPFTAVRLIHPHISVVDALLQGGVQVFWLDGEHSPWSLSALHEAMIVINRAGGVPLVRVPAVTIEGPKTVLDLGAQGVIFPFVHTAVQAETAVAACKYPPVGKRGWGGGGQMMGHSFGLNPSTPNYPAAYAKAANANVLVLLMIESKEAVENLEEIASVQGVSGWFVGVGDLSFSLGHPGDTAHAEVQEALSRILAIAQRFNIPVGFPLGAPDQFPALSERGFSFFHGPSDHDFLIQGARTFLGALKK